MVSQLSKEQIRKLANQLMFDLSDQEIEDILEEFKTLTKQMESLQKIDTTNVAPMVYPFELITSTLREDEEVHHLTLEEIKLNAPLVKEDYFVVPKVVD